MRKQIRRNTKRAIRIYEILFYYFSTFSSVRNFMEILDSDEYNLIILYFIIKLYIE